MCVLSVDIHYCHILHAPPPPTGSPFAHPLHSPARFSDDHLRAQFMELAPEFLGLQPTLDAGQLLTPRARHGGPGGRLNPGGRRAGFGARMYGCWCRRVGVLRYSGMGQAGQTARDQRTGRRLHQLLCKGEMSTFETLLEKKTNAVTHPIMNCMRIL